MSPADFPASNFRARPKSAMQAVRLFFRSTFLLLISLRTKQNKTCPQSSAAGSGGRQSLDEKRTCERWMACGRPCVRGCRRAGRQGRGPPSGRCGKARSRTQRWPSGSPSGSPTDAKVRNFKQPCSTHPEISRRSVLSEKHPLISGGGEIFHNLQMLQFLI